MLSRHEYLSNLTHLQILSTVTDVKTGGFHSWLNQDFCSAFAKTAVCTASHCAEVLCDALCHQHPFIAYSWLKTCPWCGQLALCGAMVLVPAVPKLCHGCRGHLLTAVFITACHPGSQGITQGFGFKATQKVIYFQPHCQGQGHLPLDQSAPTPIQPGPGNPRTPIKIILKIRRRKNYDWAGRCPPWAKVSPFLGQRNTEEMIWGDVVLSAESFLQRRCGPHDSPLLPLTQAPSEVRAPLDILRSDWFPSDSHGARRVQI